MRRGGSAEASFFFNFLEDQTSANAVNTCAQLETGGFSQNMQFLLFITFWPEKKSTSAWNPKGIFGVTSQFTFSSLQTMRVFFFSNGRDDINSLYGIDQQVERQKNRN